MLVLTMTRKAKINLPGAVHHVIDRVKLSMCLDKKTICLA